MYRILSESDAFVQLESGLNRLVVINVKIDFEKKKKKLIRLCMHLETLNIIIIILKCERPKAYTKSFSLKT